MCKLDPVPKIVEVGGGDIDIDFQLKNDDGSAFSAEGCVIRLSISDWLYRSATLLVYEATLSADSNGIMSVASFHVPGYDTADMSGAYVYQISIKDYLGNYESPIQGKLVLLKNNNPDNIIGGTCGGDSNPSQNLNCGFIAQDTAPENTSVLWIDTSDDSSDSSQNVNGLSNNAKTLLVAILRNAVYTSDQSANITALEAELASSGESDDSGDDSGNTDAVTYTITNALANVTTSNAVTSVAEKAVYTATLTAADGYNLDTVTVTMGGVDITSTAYSGGAVTIASVTGDVVITATAVVAEDGGDSTLTLLHSWDFTQSLTDSVGGVTAETEGKVTQDANGLAFAATGTSGTASSAMVSLGNTYAPNRTIEIDVVSMAETLSRHHRFVIIGDNGQTQGNGFVYRNGTAWSFYAYPNWCDNSEITDMNYFSGKTVTLKCDSDGYIAVYADSEYIFTTSKAAFPESVGTALWLGSTILSLENTVISAVRIYEGV